MKLIAFILIIVSTLFGQWSATSSKDEISGNMSFYAVSNQITPTERMNFPYTDIKSFIGIGCEKGNKWAYLGFNNSPNLSNDKTQNGYNLINARIKFDDKASTTSLSQEWGSKFLHFKYPEQIIEKIKKSNTFIIELEWYGNGNVYFKYPLSGAKNVIDEIFSKCNNKTKAVKENKKNESYDSDKANECIKKGHSWRFSENGNIECYKR